MKKSVLLILILLVGIGFFAWIVEIGELKVAHAGGDLSPLEAYQMLKEDPEHTFLIDSRTRPEYEFVGHPPMAYNIPYMFWTPEGMRKNDSFVRDVAARFKRTDRLLIICRSGGRSRRASDMLIEAGFEQVFNVLGGFEGDRVEDKNSTYYGYRGYINGWKHDGLPYTYEMKEELTYKPYQPCGCK
jgi:rhodanese-related sulfurtransferase